LLTTSQKTEMPARVAGWASKCQMLEVILVCLEAADCLSRRGYLPGWLGKSPNVAIHWNVYRSGLRHRRLEGG